MPSPRSTSRVPTRFRHRIDALRDRTVALWNAAPDLTAAPPTGLGPPVPLAEQIANEEDAERFLARFDERLTAAAVGPSPRTSEHTDWAELRGELRAEIQGALSARVRKRDPWIELLLSDRYFDATRSFVRAARAFEPTLALADVFQALRNVWIQQSVRLITGRRCEAPESGPAELAYSLFYPLTDNVLDDPRVPASAKRDLDRRLGRRLAGERLAPRDDGEARLFALVAKVESQYPRTRYPDVHASLLAIHDAQRGSLAQLDGDELSDQELLAITVEKGGASVLADGWLVEGALSPDEEELLFSYGVLLQLLDDLQDVRRDRAAGSVTPFVRAAERGELDAQVRRLITFQAAVLGHRILADGNRAGLVELVAQSCSLLLFQAVADDSSSYGAELCDQLAARSPVRLAWLHERRGSWVRRLARLRRRWASDEIGSVPIELLA